MATGWKPKLKIIGPMPLNYDNQAVDKSILALVHQESAFYQIVYLGRYVISQARDLEVLLSCISCLPKIIGTNMDIYCTMILLISNRSSRNSTLCSSRR